MVGISSYCVWGRKRVILSTFSDAIIFKENQAEEILSGDISQDGKLLAFVASVKKSHLLYILDLKRRQILQIEEVGSKARICKWGKNNTLWFEKEGSNGKLSIWYWKEGISRLSTLPTGAWRPAPSPNGRYVAFKKGLQSGLKIWDQSTGKTYQISTPYYISLYSWTPDGNSLVLLTRAPILAKGMDNIFSFFPPPNLGQIVLVKAPDFRKKKIVDKGILLRSSISFLKDGSFVCLKQESRFLLAQGEKGIPPLPQISSPREALPPIIAHFVLYRFPTWQASTIWTEKNTKEKFAVSNDGDYILIFTIPSNTLAMERANVKLIDLHLHKERYLGEIADPKEVIFDEIEKRFIVFSSLEIFSVSLDGKKDEIVTLHPVK